VTKLSLTRLAVAVGGLALSLTAGAGVASADPDPVINTTCSYSQVVAALNAQDPEGATEFNASPEAQSYMRSFLAAPPGRRQQMIQQVQGTPIFAEIQMLANTCNNY
jgi:hemophore-related protein